VLMNARLKLTNIYKAFGATRALRGVNLEVAPAEVHALIGENGAGKSTLMKILSGAHSAENGAIELEGKPFAPRDPLHARRCGVAMIYQELTLAPHLTVEENLLLGAEPARWGWIDRLERKRLAREALGQIGAGHISLDVPAQQLAIAEQQLVEIARAVLRRPKVLIMDEPTSTLGHDDATKLFALIALLKERDVSVIYISHFLEECQRVCDRYTVLRDGKDVATGEMRSAQVSKIIQQMVGREVDALYPRTPHPIGKPVLEVRALAGKEKPRDATFSLREGEILGIAGLIGAGRTETLRALFGLDLLKSGAVNLNGRDQTKASPCRRWLQQFGFLSENRKEEGLMLNRTVAENLLITRYAPVRRAGLISRRAEDRLTEEWMTRMEIRARAASQPVNELSGGNQQKLAFARLLFHQARIYLLDEPTRGIDVASKASIYRQIGEIAARGHCLIFVSSYLPELLGVCDSIAVMCRGVLSDKRPVHEWTEHDIIAAAIGQKVSAPG
jgi:ribose transport system ATP-binding protein